MKESPELLSDKMNEIMDGCIKRALKRFEIHKTNSLIKIFTLDWS